MIFNILVCSNFLVLIILAFLTTYILTQFKNAISNSCHTGCSCKSYNTAWFYVAHLDHFKAIIVSIILLVLPLSSNIVDFILPGWCQMYIASAQNWPATWQTRPTETSVVVVHCTAAVPAHRFKFCTPTSKILPNTLSRIL